MRSPQAPANAQPVLRHSGMFFLLACAPGSLPLASPSDTADSLTDTGLEIAPGDSTPKEKPPEHVLDAPALASLACESAITPEAETPCTFSLYWPDGELNFAGGASVQIRGRSSEGFPKQQYKLELGSSAVPEPADLLGMGRESDWVLNGMWIDRALFRNKLAYDLFRELGEGNDWAPESAYVELTLDGDYRGIYLLTETVDHDASRLDFADDDGTGSRFIVAADEAGFYSPVQYAGWEIQYPGAESQTPAVVAGVKERIALWETLLMNGGDPFTEMDLDSFVRFVLVEEFVKNNDAYYLSHRVYSHDDGSLHMVPWDLDLSLGQPSYNDNENPESWIAYRPDLVWRPALQQRFAEKFVEQWEIARQGPLATEEILGWQQGVVEHLGEAVDRNWARWDIETVDFGGYLYRVSTPDAEYLRVADWTERRLEWIDAAVATY